MGLEIIELKCKSCGAQLFLDPANRSSYITCSACGTQNVVNDDAKLSLLNRAHYFLDHEEINNAKKVIDTLHFYFPGHVEVREVENALAKKLNQMGLRVLKDKLTRQMFSPVDVGGMVKTLLEARKLGNDVGEIPTRFREWLDAQPNEYFQSVAPNMPDDELGCGAYCKSRAEYINGSLGTQRIQQEITDCQMLQNLYKKEEAINAKRKSINIIQLIGSVAIVGANLFSVRESLGNARKQSGAIVTVIIISLIFLLIAHAIFRRIRDGNYYKLHRLAQERSGMPLANMFRNLEATVSGIESKTKELNNLTLRLPELKQNMETAYSSLMANLLGGQESSAE